MTKKLKLCLIDVPTQHTWPHTGCGGTQSCNENMATTCHAMGLDFFVISPNNPKDQGSWFFDLQRTEMVSINDGGGSEQDYYNQAAKIISNRENGVDLILANGGVDVSKIILKTMGPTGLNIPVVLTNHAGVYYDKPLILSKHILYRFLTKDHEDLHLKTDAERSNSFICHTGLSDSQYDFVSSPDGYALWVANLAWGYENKGLGTFMRLAQKYKDIKFVCYGSGNKNLERLVSAVQSDNFEFNGHLLRGAEHDNVFGYANVFCQLSKLRESFGRTTIEAMSKGTPVIGYAGGATTEIVGNSPLLFENEAQLMNGFGDAFAKASTSTERSIAFDRSVDFSSEEEIQNILLKASRFFNL